MHLLRDAAYFWLILISILLSLQAAYTLYMMIYTWDQPEAEAKARAPRRFIAPKLSFTVLLPARHEEGVIRETLEMVVRAKYPASLLQVIVVCSEDDRGTVNEARRKVNELRAEGMKNVELMVFKDTPINKPHGLNFALAHAKYDVVTIFDAEDDIHPQIFRLINTVMTEEEVNVVQAGVQLMNYQSKWYSTLNVLEYFFWFKSRLHYHARYNSIPLGGNTVFFRRDLLMRIGGWDETILTEDAEIGLRLCSMGEPVRVIYDDRYVTKEETPPTLNHFIKQRTRWAQGFMQTLRKGTWRKLPTRHQRWLAFYTLAFPHVQGLLGVYYVLSLFMMFVLKVPVLIALVSYLPVLLLGAHLVTSMVGMYEFADAHGFKAPPWMPVWLLVTWFPYQLVLAYSALRALRRQVSGAFDWEKTQHIGAHRNERDEVDRSAA